jgi:hypothetical protein
MRCTDAVYSRAPQAGNGLPVSERSRSPERFAARLPRQALLENAFWQCLD